MRGARSSAGEGRAVIGLTIDLHAVGVDDDAVERSGRVHRQRRLAAARRPGDNQDTGSDGHAGLAASRIKTARRAAHPRKRTLRKNTAAMQPNSKRTRSGPPSSLRAHGVPRNESGNRKKQPVDQRSALRASLQHHPPLRCSFFHTRVSQTDMDRQVVRRYRRQGSGWRARLLTFRVALIGACVAILHGCGATAVGENPEGIWFREPFIGGGDMAGEAARHCASTAKSAYTPVPSILRKAMRCPWWRTIAVEAGGPGRTRTCNQTVMSGRL